MLAGHAAQHPWPSDVHWEGARQKPAVTGALRRQKPVLLGSAEQPTQRPVAAYRSRIIRATARASGVTTSSDSLSRLIDV
jgi:hypothetical protein